MREAILAYVASEAAKTRPLGKTAFQKIIYFVQEGGVPLRFTYGIHLFGPYSEALAKYVETKVYEGVLAYNSDGPATLVAPGPVCDLALKDGASAILMYKGTVDAIIAILASKSATELELLSTTHMIATRSRDDSVEGIADATHRAKSGKFSKPEIRKALRELRKMGLMHSRQPQLSLADVE